MESAPAISTRQRQRAERIRKEIPIAQVLADYGYHVRSDAEDREQQFPCNLHGDGSDVKPSARIYPSSNSWYCYACSTVRDAIATVREIDNLGFNQALTFLEHKYGLPNPPWVEEPGSKVEPPAPTGTTYAEECHRLSRLLDNHTKERDAPMEVLLAYWEALDKITFLVHEEGLSERQGQGAIVKIRERLKKATNGNPD
jgi:DNA primase